MSASPRDRLPDATPSAGGEAPVAVRLMRALEGSAVLDRLSGPVGLVSAVAQPPWARDLLTGKALGHALHPAMTDVPIGLWSSSLLLDVLGHEQDRAASRRLLAAGLLSAVPTVLTGLAEWRGTSRPESRVASVHASLNAVSVGLYTGSLAARRGSPRAGVALSLAATTVATVAGVLGGHLATARKTGSRDASYVSDGVGPQLSRGPA